MSTLCPNNWCKGPASLPGFPGSLRRLHWHPIEEAVPDRDASAVRVGSVDIKLSARILTLRTASLALLCLLIPYAFPSRIAITFARYVSLTSISMFHRLYNAASINRNQMAGESEEYQSCSFCKK